MTTIRTKKSYGRVEKIDNFNKPPQEASEVVCHGLQKLLQCYKYDYKYCTMKVYFFQPSTRKARHIRVLFRMSIEISI